MSYALARRRAGAALLEAIVAMTILVTAALAFVALSSASSRAVGHAREAERETREASAFLDAVSLWPRADLDRRLGTRQQGPWLLRIDRPEPTLYEVILTDSTGNRQLLSTSLYRPDDSR